MNAKSTGAANEPKSVEPLAFVFANDRSRLSDVRDEVRARLHSLDVDDATIHAVDLTLEELAGNVIRHGYARGEVGQMRVDVSVTPSFVRVDIADDARPFDPTSHPEPKPFRSVGDAPVGGRGISMVRKVARALRYRFDDGRNRVEVEVARNAQV